VKPNRAYVNEIEWRRQRRAKYLRNGNLAAAARELDRIKELQVKLSAALQEKLAAARAAQSVVVRRPDVNRWQRLATWIWSTSVRRWMNVYYLAVISFMLPLALKMSFGYNAVWNGLWLFPLYMVMWLSWCHYRFNRVTVPKAVAVPLRDAVRLWLRLPADLRDVSRPVLDRAFELAVLPEKDTAKAEVRERRDVLAEYNAEATSRVVKVLAEPVGREDIDVARATLAGMREVREMGKPLTPPPGNH
jgi:hypothetical protein